MLVGQVSLVPRTILKELLWRSGLCWHCWRWWVGMVIRVQLSFGCFGNSRGTLLLVLEMAVLAFMQRPGIVVNTEVVFLPIYLFLMTHHSLVAHSSKLLHPSAFCAPSCPSCFSCLNSHLHCRCLSWLLVCFLLLLQLLLSNSSKALTALEVVEFCQ